MPSPTQLFGLVALLAVGASPVLSVTASAHDESTPFAGTHDDLDSLLGLTGAFGGGGRPQISLWQALHDQRQKQQRQREEEEAAAGSAGIVGRQVGEAYPQQQQQQQQQQVAFSIKEDKDKKKKQQRPHPDPSDGSHDEPPAHPDYPAHCFYQPLDHFDPDNDVVFCQRYWVSAEHYRGAGGGGDVGADADNHAREGGSSSVGPVFVLDGGETSGANRLPFLETGILNILSNATSGIGIVLEHRYYGRSLPNVSYPSHEPMSLSTDDLRFLNNEQAEMDSVRFIQGLDLGFLHPSLAGNAMGPDARPWIYYGGSYAGARAAHMIKGFGYEGDRLEDIPPPHPAVAGLNRGGNEKRGGGGGGDNVENPSSGRVDTGNSKIGVDIGVTGIDRPAQRGLVWGSIASSAVTHAQVSYPEYFEAIQQWAPDKCMRTMENAVEAIDALLDLDARGGNGELRRRVQELFGLEDLAHVEDFGETIASVLGGWQARNWDPKVGSTEFYRFCDALTAGGANSSIGFVHVPASVLNYAAYVKENIVSRCPADEHSGKRDIERCFGTYDVERYRQHDLGQKWRLWLFQVCNQWGYFMPSPPEGGKRILSKHITLDYSSKTCKMAFPAGKHHVVPKWPDVESVNARGDFALAADRLAYIDGDSDPWRPATPQSDVAPRRNSTTLRPVKMIPDAVHHFDENGLLDPAAEPKRIREVHAFEIDFVNAWIEEWRERKEAGKL